MNISLINPVNRHKNAMKRIPIIEDSRVTNDTYRHIVLKGIEGRSQSESDRWVVGFSAICFASALELIVERVKTPWLPSL